MGSRHRLSQLHLRETNCADETDPSRNINPEKERESKSKAK